jgi:hypothetical protein
LQQNFQSTVAALAGAITAVPPAMSIPTDAPHISSDFNRCPTRHLTKGP